MVHCVSSPVLKFSCKPLAVMCVRRDVQVYELSSMHFLPKEWIMERWEDGFYITAMAGSAGGSSLVVMSKGTPYTQQSYKVRMQSSGPSQGDNIESSWEPEVG